MPFYNGFFALTVLPFAFVVYFYWFFCFSCFQLIQFPKIPSIPSEAPSYVQGSVRNVNKLEMNDSLTRFLFAFLPCLIVVAVSVVVVYVAVVAVGVVVTVSVAFVVALVSAIF